MNSIHTNRFESIVRDEREGCTSEAASVDTDGSLAREKLLAQRNCERHVLLLDVHTAGVTFCKSVHDAMPDSLT